MSERNPAITTADRAFRLAATALGDAPDPRVFEVLQPRWRAQLEAIQGCETDPSTAGAVLRAEHAAEARPDPARIHVSWLARALREESSAVRRTVLVHWPDQGSRARLRQLLEVDEGDLTPDRQADPEAVRWVVSLWTERLVGGPPSRPDDPPVVLALARLGNRGFYRLSRAIGLAKRAIVAESAVDESHPRPEGWPMLKPDESGWMLQVAAREGPEFDPSFVAIARRDTASVPERDRRGLARLGLVTVARLLSAVEPHRARWAMQHAPYEIARFLRAQMSLPRPLPAALIQAESRLLAIALDRLGITLRPGDPSGAAP